MAKILIVDDDPDIIEASRIFLEKQGHQVFFAYNRQDGMKQVEQNKPDLLIMDIIMEQPDDGMAMAQELRRGGFDAPILMLTSISKITGMDYDKDEEILPVDEFIEKPVEPSVLLAKVSELLGKRK